MRFIAAMHSVSKAPTASSFQDSRRSANRQPISMDPLPQTLRDRLDLLFSSDAATLHGLASCCLERGEFEWGPSSPWVRSPLVAEFSPNFSPSPFWRSA